MEFETHADAMVSQNIREPRQIFAGQKMFESFMPMATAPVVLPVGRQQRVAESQLRLGQVATHEICVLRFESTTLQPFLGKKQARATVHQQARGFAKGDTLRLKVMAAR